MIKKIFIFIIVICLATLTAVRLGLANQYLGSVVSERLKHALADQQSLRLDIVEPKFNLASFSAKRISLFIPRILLAQELTEISFVPGLKGLVTARSIGGEATAKLLAGSLRVAGRVTVSAQQFSLNGELVDLALFSHPAFAPLKIESGLVNANLDSLECAEQFDSCNGSAKLKITEFKKTTPTLLPDGTFIPAIENLNLEFKLDLAAANLQLTELQLATPWGEMTGAGKAKFARSGQLLDFELTMPVALTAKGRSELGNVIASLSDYKLPPDLAEFLLKIKGDRGNIAIEFTPL